MALRAAFFALALVSAAGEVDGPPAALRGTDSLAATEEEPDASMLTPQNATEPMEAWALIREVINRELHSEHWQWLVAVVALCFGVTMVACPKPAFQQITVTLIFALTYTMAMGDLHERYKNQHFEGAIIFHGVMLWQVIVAIEIAVCASLVAWRGFDGVQQLLAMVIGIGPMKMLQATLNDSGIFGASPWWNIIVLTISAMFGLFLMRKDRLKLLLGYIFPFIGGKLISCSVGWLLWYLVNFTWSKPWIDFYHSLPFDETRSAIQPAPGIGWSTPTDIAGPPWMGWAGGTALWLIISLCASFYHHHSHHKAQRASQTGYKEMEDNQQ